MADFSRKRSSKKQVSFEEMERFSKYWYRRLRDFSKGGSGWDWQFTEANVIAFLRHLLAEGTPVWKRLKAAENLLWYREHILKVDEPSLDFVVGKLKELNAFEKRSGGKEEQGFSGWGGVGLVAFRVEQKIPERAS